MHFVVAFVRRVLRLVAGKNSASLSILSGLAVIHVLSAVPAHSAWFPFTPLSKTNSFEPKLLPPKPEPADRKKLPAVFCQGSPKTISDLRSMEQHVKALVARISPAVVAVEVGDGSGSAVVISADGLVVTAGHVATTANLEVRFTFPDGKKVPGRTLGADEESDIGLMKITSPGPWPHVSLGDMDQAQTGDWVLALGHPGGFDRTRSLVVRMGRLIRIAPEALQTDCTISPGDSGGPLLDMHGRVIGIHSSISTSMVENFHVPITALYDAWDNLSPNSKTSGPASKH